MRQTLLICLAVLLLVIGGIWLRHFFVDDGANAELSTVPLLSQTNDLGDQSLLLLTPAPLPKPCDSTNKQVKFCVQPVPLIMSRERYDYFSQLWGIRETAQSRIDKLVQTNETTWELRLRAGSEKPLIWIDSDNPESLQLFPVSPYVEEIRSPFSIDRLPEVIAKGPSSLTIDFGEQTLSTPRKIVATWLNNEKLQIQFAPLEKPFTVIIDPGHGGTELGAVVPPFPDEKELSLKFTEALKKQLESRGILIKLTRGNDTTVSLPERLSWALDPENDLFVSLHLDSVPFYDGPRPACFFGRADVYNLCQAISQDIQALTGNEIASPARKHFFVLQSPIIPSVLIEIANLQNPEQAVILKKNLDQFISLWSEKTAASISTYLAQ